MAKTVDIAARILGELPATRGELVKLLYHGTNVQKGVRGRRIDTALNYLRRHNAIRQDGCRMGSPLWIWTGAKLPPDGEPRGKRPPSAESVQKAQRTRQDAWDRYVAIKERFEASLDMPDIDTVRLASELSEAIGALAATKGYTR